jgi:molybdenum cofactor cytidylyltransferase
VDGWSALILAGGAGRRFGGGKLLAPLAGVPVIRRTVEAVLSGGFGDVVVASGADHDGILAALDGISCRIVPAPDWQEGMGASLCAGLAAVGEPERGVFVFLGDMPLASVELCAALADMATREGYAARPRVGGKPGHPVAFTCAALPDLAGLAGDVGAAALLKGRSEGVGYLDTDSIGAVLDIDSPEDLEAATHAWNACATSATSDSAISRGALPKP